MSFSRIALLSLAFVAGAAGVSRAQALGQHSLYVVPGVHYGTPSRTSFALTAFLDDWGGIIGKGPLLIVEGGRDAYKAQLGLANVSKSPFGVSVQAGYLQTRKRPIDAMPNARYAGTEAHFYIGIVNLGAGFYAPVGNTSGRRGLLSLSAGLGF